MDRADAIAFFEIYCIIKLCSYAMMRLSDNNPVHNISDIQRPPPTICETQIIAKC